MPKQRLPISSAAIMVVSVKRLFVVTDHTPFNLNCLRWLGSVTGREA